MNRRALNLSQPRYPWICCAENMLEVGPYFLCGCWIERKGGTLLLLCSLVGGERDRVVFA